MLRLLKATILTKMMNKRSSFRKVIVMTMATSKKIVLMRVGKEMMKMMISLTMNISKSSTSSH